MLTLVYGTDWVANRDRILNMIGQDVRLEQDGRILMVPELISHETERRLCMVAGDTSSRFAEVLSFPRLVGRVMDAAGRPVQPCLDNGGRIAAMAAAARNLHGQLKAYASVATKPEFLTSLVDAVDEWKRCCISSDDLMQASKRTEGSFAQKLEELALLLESYDALCLQGKRDPRDQMTWLLEQLEDCDFAVNHTFYVDGFPDFTRQHMEILKHLIVNSPNVVISATCDIPGSTAPGFEKAGATAAELIRFAKNAGVEVKLVNIEPEHTPVSPLQNRLFQGSSAPAAALPLSVYTADTPYQECVAAADRIMTLVQMGIRYRQISVVCGDMNTYRSAIRMIFDRCKIPVYLSGTEDILERPVITTVLSAMDAALGGFEQREVIRYLKSMLSPLPLDMSDKIENYAIVWNISGSRWLSEWTNHPDGLGGQWTEDAVAALRELNEARRTAVEPLRELHNGFVEATNLRQQVQALYRFLDRINLAERLSAFADHLDAQGDNAGAQILDQLWEILLTALEQMYDILGQTVWDSETFTRLFRLILSQYDVGTIPTRLDSVVVGPVSAMRCQQTDHLIVLGVLEGTMPGYTGSTGVLTDRERTQLRQMGVPLTGGSLEGIQAEFAEIYGVFCGARKTVTVSCPAGQPSFLYRRLRDLAGGEQPKREVLGVARGDAWEAAALLSGIADQKAAAELGILAQFDEMEEKKKYCLGNVTRENIQGLYGSHLNLSASQVDRLADCRFSYFLRYGLRLKERKNATVDPAEFGTFVHAVLEKTGQAVKELGGFQKVTLEQILDISASYAREYASERFSELDSQRVAYLFARNGQELSMVVQELWQELQASRFEPFDFEVAFGDGGKMQAIEISGQQMQARLRGFVDRVDVWRENGQNYFRVVDYKTGKKDFDYCDVFNGLGLQMLLYLFALEDAGEDMLGKAPVPAGVQYFPARVPLISSDGMMSDEEAAFTRQKAWKRKGLLLSDEDVLQAMEPEEKPKRMGYTRNKEGEISGDVASREQFAMLKDYVFGVLGKMVDEIASGAVKPNPYTRGSSHNACTFCPYGEVCHQTEVEDRRNYKAMSADRFWEEVEKEMRSSGGRTDN